MAYDNHLNNPEYQNFLKESILNKKDYTLSKSQRSEIFRQLRKKNESYIKFIYDDLTHLVFDVKKLKKQTEEFAIMHYPYMGTFGTGVKFSLFYKHIGRKHHLFVPFNNPVYETLAKNKIIVSILSSKKIIKTYECSSAKNNMAYSDDVQNSLQMIAAFSESAYKIEEKFQVFNDNIPDIKPIGQVIEMENIVVLEFSWFMSISSKFNAAKLHFEEIRKELNSSIIKEMKNSDKTLNTLIEEIKENEHFYTFYEILKTIHEYEGFFPWFNHLVHKIRDSENIILQHFFRMLLCIRDIFHINPDQTRCGLLRPNISLETNRLTGVTPIKYNLFNKDECLLCQAIKYTLNLEQRVYESINNILNNIFPKFENHAR
mgnify:FL=1